MNGEVVMDKYKIYPKQYRNEKIAIQKNKCFVLMQFSKDLDMVYGTLKSELNDIGITCSRADDVIGSPIIFNKILTEMFSSQFIIAELSYINPNVFYELGIAHSFKDPSNIIIIKKKSDAPGDYPFDLKHLQYIEYSDNNLSLLSAQIKKYIESTKYLTNFYEILNIKGIIPYISDNQDDFVEYVSVELNEDIELLTEILSSDIIEIQDCELKKLFNHYENVINKAINTNRFDVLDGILKIYFELFSVCSNNPIAEVYLNKFIANNYSITNSTSWKIDLICKLVNEKKMLNFCLPWILEYFSKLQVTSIDLNKHKLERLLMTCNYKEVNDVIIDSLFSSNSHVREYMADVIGEKKLVAGLKTLYSRLEIEQNNYVCRSIVEAIGKIDDVSGIPKLLTWFENNRVKFDEEKYDGIYNHMTFALQRMDNSKQKTLLKSFVNTYKSKINIPGIDNYIEY